MIGQHHQFNGHELEQTPGDGEGQRHLACYSPWGRKESGMTQRLNNNNKTVGWGGEEATVSTKPWLCPMCCIFSF